MSAVCAVDGCERPTHSRGWCTKHYSRWRKHGDPLVAITDFDQTPERVAAKFWRLVDRRGPSDCWPWIGGLDGHGYGTFGVRVSPGKWRNEKAYRFAYELLVGPIPDGLHLDHLCRNRACVNPAHLEPVTNRVNGLRGESFAAKNARKTHCPRGHEYTPESTRIKMSRHGHPGRECRICHTLRAHEKAKARRTGDSECPICGDRFATDRGLRVHTAKFHGVNTSPHGTRSKYVCGCRCDDCVRANSAAISARKAMKR